MKLKDIRNVSRLTSAHRGHMREHRNALSELDSARIMADIRGQTVEIARAELEAALGRPFAITELEEAFAPEAST